MDESLQNRLRNIERRQNLLLVLLVVPYFFGLAELVGYWVAGVFAAACWTVVLVWVFVSRRRKRSGTGA
ncbi:hypothetical protein [Halogeometricum limi]|uniref:Uncharacterized protein n=1 Tax=Halogeometricum limi TaxID=555875 RepID=A0A1I6I1D3_9EURY|nr:hypothetical protein [Halogeometricum limi]SFR60521.1 hypothetical protein SAMN04488124_2696 [Halogeometricum limi]